MGKWQLKATAADKYRMALFVGSVIFLTISLVVTG